MNNKDVLYIDGSKYLINNPLNLVRAFILLDGSVKNYDLKKINDNVKDAKDLSYNIGVRKSTKKLDDCLMKNKKTIYKLLNNFNEKDELLDLSNEKWNKNKKILIEVIKNLVEPVGNGVGIATATKILHKLRPGIVPIIDSKVCKLYLKKTNLDIDDLENILDKIRKDMLSSKQLIDEIKKNLYLFSCPVFF